MVELAYSFRDRLSQDFNRRCDHLRMIGRPFGKSSHIDRHRNMFMYCMDQMLYLHIGTFLDVTGACIFSKKSQEIPRNS